MSDFDAPHTVTVARPRSLSVRRAIVQVAKGKDAGAKLEFEGRARIGAGPADLRLADPKVSGLHCEVLLGADIRVRDLGSKNGTFVGSTRVIEAVLQPGETFSVGDTRLKVLSAAAATVELAESDDFFGLVGQSPAMRALAARLERLAASDTTVLVQGETGTGKERVAEALHLAGPRAQAPLVTVDCGALPAGIIESELFGHEKGAFTGAVASVAGAFERARGGTLVLDEVGELPLDLQPKLLRALESRSVRRLGGARALPIDVRIVAATNRDLQLEVAGGRFREDLYYRLAVVTLTVPPLRERIEDVPLLAAHFARDLAADPARILTPDALAALCRHAWPGNVRELRNTLERAIALAEPVRLEARAHAPESAAPAIDLQVPLRLGKQRLIDAYERAYVTALIAECKGNLSEAARRAGIERISLYRLLDRHGLRGD